MRRIVRWLKQLLTGRKEEHRGLQANHVGTDWGDGPEKEKKRWSFAKQRKSEADGGARSSGLDAVAPPAAVEWSQLVMRPREDARAREHRAAVVIQKTFRGYLARRALRALRSLVKIQALVRGYLVRKQAAMTLHRLQTLMRLQADSIAVKNASYQKSMEQEERIFARDVQMKPLATPVHRRMLSDSTDSNYERSPRIVEMDTCHLRSRSSRITSRYNPDHLPEYHRHAAPTPSCSPLPGGKQQQPARLSFRRSARDERDPRGSKTAQSTPRFASHDSSSPAKSVEHSLASTPRRRATQRDRDALVSPRYMAGTASSAARTRWHSAPRQWQTMDAEQAPRTSVVSRDGASRRSSCSHAHGGGFCFQCSDVTRGSGFSGISFGDEVARNYYLDSFW
ncbi:unnamed protein product [Miscanthus lutarioriparius]|uniref:DUF4005 domain-containing protein n=1 Tax=Miscanthus lutarioriparius TaxID=422564 RepID=A0A811NYA9_9POAL|nr:unnamed protein product [Miscanthus lutarioriparius]